MKQMPHQARCYLLILLFVLGLAQQRLGSCRGEGDQEQEKWHFCPQFLRVCRLAVMGGGVGRWDHEGLDPIWGIFSPTGCPWNPKLPLPSASLPCSPGTEPQQTHLCCAGELWGTPAPCLGILWPAWLQWGWWRSYYHSSLPFIVSSLLSPCWWVGSEWGRRSLGVERKRKKMRASKDILFFQTSSSEWLCEWFLLTSVSASPSHHMYMCTFAHECTRPHFSLCRSCCSLRTGWGMWLEELYRTPLRGSPSPTSTRRWVSQQASMYSRGEGGKNIGWLWPGCLQRSTVQNLEGFALIRCSEAAIPSQVFSFASVRCN